MTTPPPEPSPLSGSTSVVAVIGDPIAHSLSPALHNAAYRALGFDGVFVACAVRAGGADGALAGARDLGLLGLAVTTPHKEAVARAADQVDSTVEQLGAANTVRFRSGVSVAYSTDGDGFLDDLRRNAGFDPADRRCAVLGAGGAARAIVRALGAAGARSVVVVNRTAERAQRAALLAGPVGAVGEIDVTGDADLVVNATSIGLSGGDGTEGAALASRVGTGQLVVDLRYGRRPTPFLAAASARGAAVRDGLGMLVHQAALQVAIHTGLPGPTDAMWAAVDHVGTSDGRWRDLAEGI